MKRRRTAIDDDRNLYDTDVLLYYIRDK